MRLTILALLSAVAAAQYPVQVGDRPTFLIEKMEESDLKTELGKFGDQMFPPSLRKNITI